MSKDDQTEDSAADVAKWLHKRGITSQEFQRDPQKWIALAIRSIRNQHEPKAGIHESGAGAAIADVGNTTGSIKGYFGGKYNKPRKRVIKKVRVKGQ